MQKNSYSKIVIFLTLSVSILGTAAAIEWNNPSSDDEKFATNDLELNVTEDTATYVYFWYRSSGDSDYSKIDNETSASSGNYYTHTTKSKVKDGTYDFKANNSQGNITRTEIVLDTQEPSLDSNSPKGRISDKSPTVEASVSDNGDAGVNYTFLNVTDSNGDDLSDTKGTSRDLSDLSDEEYTVDYKIVDNVGNEEDDSWTFTVDTSYDGDTEPDVPDDEYILLEDDEEYYFEVNLSEEDEGSDITVKCLDGDDDEIDSETNSVSDDTTFTCEVSGDDYADSEEEITIEMSDAAGNTETYDAGTYYFDGTPPTVTDENILGSVVNGDFKVEFSATDTSGLDTLEYFYNDDSVEEGDGTEVDIGGDAEDFEASVNNISAGENTVYFRIKDNAGRWSDTESIDFDYRPNAEPDVGIDVPDDVSVTAGGSTSFDVTLENTGDIFISSMNLNASVEGVFSDPRTVEDFEPGDSRTLTFDVSTEKGDIGRYNITVSSDSPSVSATLPFTVEATEGQKDELNSQLSNYSSKLDNLESRVKELRKKVGEDRKERLSSNFSQFRQDVEEAEEAKDNSEYYRVSSLLEGIDSDFQTASESYDTVREEYRTGRRNMFILIGLALLLIVMGGVGAFIHTSDEYELDLETVIDSDIDVGSVEDLKSRINSIISDEEEAEEFEWDGFN